MRIGLYSGPAVVGNMGSKNRMDYTMMGDTVNTAARLEGINKLYGTYTLIGETTCRAADNSLAVREIDSIRVVGKKAPVTIFQLLGYAGDVDEQMQTVVDHYNRGLQAYRNRSWKQADEYFNKALEISPSDGPSQTMLERCRYFRTDPPAEGWDRAYDIRTKY